MKSTHTIKAGVWLYPGMAGWHFISLPKSLAAEIKEWQKPKKRRGWGSIPVQVTIGNTTWKTSIFPDKQSGTYLMPLKAEVRKKEDIGEGDKIDVTIKL